MEKPQETIRLARWYFGGLAGAGAACITHPLDLLKVHLQTHQGGKLSVIKITGNIIRQQGVLALYNGLSASLLRQLTYSTTRFGIYEVVKQNISAPDENMAFYKKILLAAFAGAMGGLVGTPADMVNVRMQNDIKLPREQRRNYKHAIDGLIQVYRKEGVRYLFSGATTATSRAVLMTIGQISFYDQIKQLLLQTAYFNDNLITHFSASTMAGAIATTMTQPLDVLKTRTMNAKPGEYKNLWHCITVTAKLGPLGFFKGYVPAFVRLAPHTILTFVFFEQLRMNFGVKAVISN
ncbi:mitochondrial dicarboxylate carrier-like [Argiope bruennichi]|uniref:Mitochondrial dicarboxylate carrier like protein n=1 Tax=Argiope bruennichi TaxID=94029 RepID=A0A8T0FWF8_ARGBR|nr:mitochondrial dicarboxylate carrier-like [Argiope bruennichi]XP_055931113.1 mitochondrial dicarboxylate carrier-like [Argiope bruennichi]XP_055931114.1 mitochondrial dicarboxylate carrier-like [Argiope bruennichi]KAF8793890.1 Mitochondrial dicarboxylate carrier like protein [Argiope bruennichi]